MTFTRTNRPFMPPKGRAGRRRAGRIAGMRSEGQEGRRVRRVRGSEDLRRSEGQRVSEGLRGSIVPVLRVSGGSQRVSEGN